MSFLGPPRCGDCVRDAVPLSRHARLLSLTRATRQACVPHMDQEPSARMPPEAGAPPAVAAEKELRAAVAADTIKLAQMHTLPPDRKERAERAIEAELSTLIDDFGTLQEVLEDDPATQGQKVFTLGMNLTEKPADSLPYPWAQFFGEHIQASPAF